MGGVRFGDLNEGVETGLTLFLTYMYCDRLQAALRFINQGIDEVSSRGWMTVATAGYAWRAIVELRLGDLRAAEADAVAGFDVIQFLPPHTPAWWLVVGAAIEAALLRGDLDTARRVEEEQECSPEKLDGYFIPNPLQLFGELRLAQGRLDEAVAHLETAGRRARDRGHENPSRDRWREPLALALARLDRVGEARALSEEAVARARGVGSQISLGSGLRAKGLVENGDPDLLEQSVVTLRETEARLEYARSLTEYGAALRRLNRRSEAREPLREGLHLAHVCGATALATRAREELVATGARPRKQILTGVDSLTPSERRIAGLAATGMTNPEIAQRLFITRKTVEKHLGNAYLKLEIDSRRQLADALKRQRTDAR
jgi:DNA-binding CsgD family transcriptional regulator